MNYINILHEYRLALAMYAEGHYDHGKRARETLTADLGSDWQRTLAEVSTAFTERKQAERSEALSPSSSTPTPTEKLKR